MGKATIYDYVRMCKANVHKCDNCPMWNYKCTVFSMDSADVDKANEIILKWCEEHPVKTRQSELLKIFPNIKTNDKGRIYMCPQKFDWKHKCHRSSPNCDCLKCMDEYWLAEVDENGDA